MLSRVRQEAVFVALALVLAYGIYQTAGMALGTSNPAVAVTSGSMEPHFYRGDMVLVGGKSFDRIAVGDVLVFETDAVPVPVIHRVVEQNQTALQTQGDAVSEQHDWEKHITEDQVIGVRLAVIPYVGHFKLLPTCLYLDLVQGGAPPTVCP